MICVKGFYCFPVQGRSRAIRRVLHVSATKTFVHTDAKELAKATNLANFLWSLFRQLGEFNTKHAQYIGLKGEFKAHYEKMCFEMNFL